MSIYKRPGSQYYQCKITLGGETIRRSTSTSSRAQARLFEERLRQQLWQLKKLGNVAATWDMAAEKWLEDHESKRSYHSDCSIIAWFTQHLRGKRLVNINRDEIDRLRGLKLEEASPATVNRYMALMRAILRAARDQWEWLNKIPAVPMYTTEKPEPRWITKQQFESLARELPSYLERLARFAVLTGLRRTPLITLTWPHVDMKRGHVWIGALRSKNKRPIAVPLGTEAKRTLRTVKGQHDEYVFSYEGGPIPAQNGYVWKQWRLAVQRAGITPFRFHDLRHTFASWHVQAGTPLHVLQELGAWSSYEMVQSYAHLDARHLKKWAHNLGHTASGRQKRSAGK